MQTVLSTAFTYESETYLQKGERRLAAIMFTDIVGYSALTQENEPLALQMLAKLKQAFESIFGKHDGRMIKTMGDGFLVEFPSAMDAVLCGVELQESIHRRASGPQSNKVHLKIGVHVGDVIREAGDVYGDAVNIASRLESIAGPGGICISQQVFDQVKNKLSYGIAGMGPQNLKNISSPVETYSIILPWSSQTADTVHPTARDKHRLVVLPLNSFSPDPNDEYFADGMMEEIITRLSGLQGLKVIARTSAMKYKGVRKSISEIASELNVGSALEGSVRKSGERMRITLQLIDTSTEEHLWANSYDRNLADVFAVQTDIAESVASSLEVKLLAHELETLRRAGTKNVVAYTHYLKGRDHLAKRSAEAMRAAKKEFETALAEDSAFARAYSGLADCAMLTTEESTSVEDYERARPLVTKALELDDDSAEAHASMGLVLLALDYDSKGAEHEFKRAVSINIGYATAHQWYAFALANLGKSNEMLEQIRIALELDPLSAAVWHSAGYIYLLAGNYVESLKCIERTLELSPEHQWARTWLAWHLIEVGRNQEAISSIRKVVHNEPDSAIALAVLGWSLARSGNVEEAQQISKQLEELKDQSRARAGDFWFLYVPLGNPDRAFELAEEALEKRDMDPSSLRIPSNMKVLRSDPRWAALLKKYNAIAT